jgi:CysZ protein
MIPSVGLSMPAPPLPASRPRPAGFAEGFASLFEAVGLFLRTRELWPWAIIPSLVLLALEGLFVWLGVFVARPWLMQVLPEATNTYGRIGADIAGFGFAAVIAVIGWFAALILAGPLSAPALERIVDVVERQLGAPPRPQIGFLREMFCGFRALLGALAIGLPLLVLFWLAELVFPALVVLTLPLHGALSALLVAWGLFDYPLTLRGVGFRERLRLMRLNFPAALGFGIAFSLVFWLPCCGVALLPLGAAGATRLTLALRS